MEGERDCAPASRTNFLALSLSGSDVILERSRGAKCRFFLGWGRLLLSRSSHFDPDLEGWSKNWTAFSAIFARPPKMPTKKKSQQTSNDCGYFEWSKENQHHGLYGVMFAKTLPAWKFCVSVFLTVIFQPNFLCLFFWRWQDESLPSRVYSNDDVTNERVQIAVAYADDDGYILLCGNKFIICVIIIFLFLFLTFMHSVSRFHSSVSRATSNWCSTFAVTIVSFPLRDASLF